MQIVKTSNKKRGVSLVELIVAVTIFGFVAIGSASSAVLFAKIASSHENQSDFRRDLRIGFEQMAFDVRNANGVSKRANKTFTLTYNDSPDVRYWYNTNNEVVYRQETGSPRTVVIHNVSAFDVLTSSGDVGNNATLNFDSDAISLEKITLKSSNGRTNESELTMTNLTLKLRSS